MTSIDTVVIGAGHAGLSVSRLLSRAGCSHVVLDRGRVGERWRSERWDSLHLLTPNWMTRLPDRWYRGPDPDGFMSAADLVGVLEQYAETFDVPVLTGTSVLEVSAGDGGYRVVTDQGIWRARRVVVATGPHGKPFVPPGLRTTEVLTANRYRNPGQLAPGGVLVVGASASGVQIADELARAGREVVLAVGRHTRLPRSYRGTGCVLVAGGHRPAGPHDRRRARPGCGAPRDVAAAGRAQPPAAGRPGPRPRHPAGTRGPARRPRERGHGARRPVPRRPGRHRPGRRSDHAPVPRRGRPAGSRERTDRRGLVARPSAAHPVAVEPDPARPALGADRHDPAGDGLRARPPVASAPDHRAKRLDPAAPRGHACPGGVRRRAAVPAPPGLGVHRRRAARRPRRGRALDGGAAAASRVSACAGGECAS